jgi:hypothetical protein
MLLGNQLAGSGDARWSTKTGVLNQTTHILREQRIKCQRRPIKSIPEGLPLAASTLFGVSEWQRAGEGVD